MARRSRRSRWQPEAPSFPILPHEQIIEEMRRAPPSLAPSGPVIMPRNVVNFTWAEFLEDAAKPAQGLKASEENTHFRTEWAGGTYANAMRLAAEGWSEGLDKIRDRIAAFSPPTYRTMVRNLDVAGAYPVAAIAAAGEMQCMVDIGETISPRPVVRFVLGGFLSSSVEPNEILNRGAVLCGIVDALETAGTRHEHTHALYATDRAETFAYAVNVELKAADQPLERDRVAFALMHPSMFRRLGFRMIERHYDQPTDFAGYGMPCAIPASVYPDAVIIPNLDIHNQHNYATPSLAHAEITRLMSAAGVDVEGGAP